MSKIPHLASPNGPQPNPVQGLCRGLYRSGQRGHQLSWGEAPHGLVKGQDDGGHGRFVCGDVDAAHVDAPGGGKRPQWLRKLTIIILLILINVINK